MYCKNCGEIINDDAMFCAKCGTAKDKGTSFCSNCGKQIDGASFCPACGTKTDTTPVESAPVENNAPVQPTSVQPTYYQPAQNTATASFISKNKKPIIIVSIIVGVILAFLLIIGSCVGNSVDFEEIYNNYCTSTWAEVGDDGSYLFLDTNPYDWDDDGLAYIDAYYAVEKINKELGLPSSLIKEMEETTGLDGKQTRTYEDLGIEVSWKYHPDKGLEVTYSKIK